MKVLLIGQAPGPRTDPELPLFPVPRTSAGGRLQELMGVTRGQYLTLFERVNLLREHPGLVGREDRFPKGPARIAAAAMRPLLAGRVVVVVGRDVARALELEAAWHEWVDFRARRQCLVSRDLGLARAAVVPHPSGRNPWYNCPANREEARAFWGELVRNLEGDPDFLLSSVPRWEDHHPSVTGAVPHRERELSHHDEYHRVPRQDLRH